MKWIGCEVGINSNRGTLGGPEFSGCLLLVSETSERVLDAPREAAAQLPLVVCGGRLGNQSSIATRAFYLYGGVENILGLEKYMPCLSSVRRFVDGVSTAGRYPDYRRRHLFFRPSIK